MIVTTRPDKPPNLQVYLPNLSSKDRALILRAYNEWRVQVTVQNAPPKGPEGHHGLLPFISMRKIGAALVWKASTATEYRRVWATLCSKVEASRWADNPFAENRRYAAHGGWELALNNALVYKHFGSRPELGVTIPTIPRQLCRGPLKWNIAKREWLPETISAAPRITLNKVHTRANVNGRSVWVLHCPTRYKELCIYWLLDHC